MIRRIIPRRSRKSYINNKEKVLGLVNAKIEKFNRLYNYSFNRVSIRNQKTRWGSCSSKKNLNFNYRIMYLPDEIADYIVVHELCHLEEFNHSRKFWDLVERGVPDYKKIKKVKRSYF